MQALRFKIKDPPNMILLANWLFLMVRVVLIPKHTLFFWILTLVKADFFLLSDIIYEYIAH